MATTQFIPTTNQISIGLIPTQIDQTNPQLIQSQVGSDQPTVGSPTFSAQDAGNMYQQQQEFNSVLGQLPNSIPFNQAAQLYSQYGHHFEALNNPSTQLHDGVPQSSQLHPSLWGTAIRPTDIPIKGPISQDFGNTSFSSANPQIYHGSGHNGLDIAVPTGTALPSNTTGTVLDVGDEGKRAYGKYVVVKGDDGITRLYGHLSLQNVKVGQQVTPGQELGLTGSTGDATGPHLHYSTFVNK